MNHSRAAWCAAILVAALVGLVGCSDETGDTGQTPTPVAPTPTRVGQPIGDPVLATIGPEGGTLASSDGVLTVVVPAGAVSAPTEFGIQTITNECFVSIGDAYRLTPDGATFEQPVALHFTYTDADLTNTVSEALGIAFQDEAGIWLWQDGAVLDDANKEIVLATEHFTDFSRLKGLQLRPDKTSVKFGQKTDVRVLDCVVPTGDPAQDEIFPLGVYDCEGQSAPDDLTVLATVTASTWAVNGQTGGTSSVGTITGSPEKATYKAPNTKPVGNPVAVSVETTTNQGSKALLVTHIHVGEPPWSGDSEVVLVYDSTAPGFSRTVTTRANVSWVFDESLGGYAPHGTVTYQLDGTYEVDNPPQTCIVFAQYSGQANEGQLILFDLGDGTFAYSGGGYASGVVITEEDSCEGSTMLPTVLSWWPGFRPPDSNPTMLDPVKVTGSGALYVAQDITFSFDGGTQTNTYRFDQQ